MALGNGTRITTQTLCRKMLSPNRARAVSITPLSFTRTGNGWTDCPIPPSETGYAFSFV